MLRLILEGGALVICSFSSVDGSNREGYAALEKILEDGGRSNPSVVIYEVTCITPQASVIGSVEVNTLNKEQRRRLDSIRLDK